MRKEKKQFAVYSLKRNLGQMEVLRHRSWNFIQKYHIRITSEYYDQICVSSFSWNLEPAELRRQLENGLPASSSGGRLQVSDVLVITKAGITTAYYVDMDRLVVLTGFFYTAASSALLTMDTRDFRIEGKAGSWIAADEIWIDGQHFFLMESQQYGRDAACAVLDSSGRKAAEDTTEGFTEEVIRQIRTFMEKQNEAISGQPGRSAPPSLENWQKSYENGEYLRSAEMAEEQNYSMIDGRMNNMPPKAHAHKQSHRNRPRKRRKGKLPLKGRESVLKRLKEYQEELAFQKEQRFMDQDVLDLQAQRKA